MTFFIHSFILFPILVKKIMMEMLIDLDDPFIFFRKTLKTCVMRVMHFTNFYKYKRVSCL